MSSPAYAVARAAATRVADHLQRHRSAVAIDPDVPVDILPDALAIESMIEAAFWASVRREEGYVPKISLAFLPPLDELHPMRFATPLALEPASLTRLAAAVERPSIHLGIWPERDRLRVWGTTHHIPPFCFVLEVVAPGLLVLKHRPREESRKFVNLAVLEGDRMKIVDERAAHIDDCPELLSSMMGFDTGSTGEHAQSVLVQLALSMRRHERGGILLVVPHESSAWRDSVVHPIRYEVHPGFRELSDLVGAAPTGAPDHEWTEAMARAVDAMAGLTAVDGATIVTTRYELLGFGAKIARRRGGESVEQVVVTEPIEGGTAERVHPGQLGGTRHLSAAQFVHDQSDTLALVASQDGRFTIFAWSPREEVVQAHRVEVLLL